MNTKKLPIYVEAECLGGWDDSLDFCSTGCPLMKKNCIENKYSCMFFGNLETEENYIGCGEVIKRPYECKNAFGRR